jgi:hypothetical protein
MGTYHAEMMVPKMTLPVPITLQPAYYSAQDLKRLEVMARDHVFDHGYSSHKAGCLLRECPPFLFEKWKLWWRDGWRACRDEERRRKLMRKIRRGE